MGRNATFGCNVNGLNFQQQPICMIIIFDARIFQITNRQATKSLAVKEPKATHCPEGAVAEGHYA